MFFFSASSSSSSSSSSCSSPLSSSCSISHTILGYAAQPEADFSCFLFLLLGRDYLSRRRALIIPLQDPEARLQLFYESILPSLEDKDAQKRWIDKGFHPRLFKEKENLDLSQA